MMVIKGDGVVRDMTASGEPGPMAAAPGGTSEDFLLALLNTTPVVDGAPTDELADPARGRSWLAGQGGGGTEAEWRAGRGGPHGPPAGGGRGPAPPEPAPLP